MPRTSRRRRRSSCCAPRARRSATRSRACSMRSPPPSATARDIRRAARGRARRRLPGVHWRAVVNRGLLRATGYELRRTARARSRRRPVLREGDRLVAAPAFVLCTVRLGSTLLRVLLDSHSEIHAPHELHLRYVSVSLDEKWSVRSMKELVLDETGLQQLLWDRILDRELGASG